MCSEFKRNFSKLWDFCLNSNKYREDPPQEANFLMAGEVQSEFRVDFRIPKIDFDVDVRNVFQN